MSLASQSIIQIPYRDKITDSRGLLSRPWEMFYRLLQDIISPLGSENTAQINNEQVTSADVIGLSVNSRNVSQAYVEYLIQRVTIGTNPVELIETGFFFLIYKPTSGTWVKVGGASAGDTSGVTLTVTSGGQVQYTSTLVDGSPSISKINFRIKTLSGKNKQYSSFG